MKKRKKRAIGFNPIHEACLRPQRMRNDPLPHRRIYIEIELLIFAGDDRLLRTPCVDFTVLTITEPAAVSPLFPLPLFSAVFSTRDPGRCNGFGWLVAIYLPSVPEIREH